jgi:multidrug efflux pump subunit AcrA (membrane-fusion protein)
MHMIPNLFRKKDDDDDDDKKDKAPEASAASNALQASLDQAKAEAAAAKTEVASLKAELSKRDAEIATLKKGDAGATASANAKASALQTAQKEIARLNGEVQRLRASLAEAKGDAAEATKIATGGLSVGMTAYVAQTGGKTLRLRYSPGLESEVLDGLEPGSSMTILGGPQHVDGYTWWNIRTPDNQEGWVAGQELRTQPE